MRNVRIFNSVIAVGGVLLQVGGAFGQGQVVMWGASDFGQTTQQSSSLLGSREVSCGSSHTAVLRLDGTVFCIGGNIKGQCNVPSGLDSVVQVSSGDDHTMALKSNGQVLVWGDSETTQGALGVRQIPAGLSGVRAIDAGAYNCLAITSAGEVVAWGTGKTNTGNGYEFGQSIVPSGLAQVREVRGGKFHTLALREDGTLVGWGRNTKFEGTPIAQATIPVGLPAATGIAAGPWHSLAVLADGSVAGWGDNVHAQCKGTDAGGGAIAGVIASGQRVQIRGVQLTGVEKVGAGSYTSLALKRDGTVVAWSFDYYGVLKIPSGLASARSISAGDYHVAAVDANGKAFIWGDSGNGATALPKTLLGLTQVAGGRYHSLGLMQGGGVIGWGYSGNGQANVPTGLPPCVEISAGRFHSLARTTTGLVRAWGSDLNGQSTVPSGLAQATDIAAGGEFSLALLSNGTMVGWGLGTTNTGSNNAYGQASPPTGSGFVELAAGEWHGVARRFDGSVACWGANTNIYGSSSNQAVVPSTLGGGVTSVSAGTYHTLVVRSDGTVLGWGWNQNGQCSGTDASDQPIGGTASGQPVVVKGQTLNGVVAVVGGETYSVGLKSDGTVVGWGWNYYRAEVVPPGLAGVSSIASGTNHTLAVLQPQNSSCGTSSPQLGSAGLRISAGGWQDVGVWQWAGGGFRVPGTASNVDLGTTGSVASDCQAQAGSIIARAGSTLLLTADASAPGNDYSIRVGGTANLAGRLWLLGVTGAGTTLPENLNIPVLSAGTVNGNFDLIQSELPPPPGFFLTLVPEDVNGRTVFSLRLLPLPGGGELTASSTGTFSGKAVAAETIDINHDGFDDLALAVDFGAAQPGLIQILLNDGAGGLGSTSVLTSIPPQPTCLAVGDVDGDGDRDVAVGISSDSTARVYLDNGAGGLTASSVFSSASGTPISIAIVEPSGASLMAASGFVAVGTSGSKLRIYRDSSLQQEITLAGAPGALRPGKTDVIRPTGINTGGTRTASIDGLLPVAETGFMQTLTLAPTGLFEIRQTFFLTAKPVAMDVADLDGDGLDDIVTTNTDPVLPATGSALPVLSIFRNSGGTFGGGVPFQPATASSGLDVSLIDVDNDGDRDIVSVYKRVGSDSEAALLRVDTLGPGTPISIGQTTVLDASDPILSARGNLDGSGGEDLFLVNQPSGAFLTGTQEVKPFLATGGLKQGDLDGDGTVGASDIALLLLDFGPCPGCASDLDGSSEVDAGDLSFLLLLFD